MRRSVAVVIAAVTAGALAAPVSAAARAAQTPDNGSATAAPALGQGADSAAGRAGAGRGAAGRGGLTAQQAEQQLDRIMLNQARRLLDLDPNKFQVFSLRLQNLQTIRRRTERGELTLVRELDQPDAGGKPADDVAYTARLDALKAYRAEAAQEVQQAHDALDQVLTAEQQAKFLMLEQRMAAQEQVVIARIREQAKQAPASAP